MQRHRYQCLITSLAGVAVLALAVPGALAEPASGDSLIEVSPDEDTAGENFQRRNLLGPSVERSENLGSGYSYWLKAWPRLVFSTDSRGWKDRKKELGGSEWRNSRPSSLDLVPGYKSYSGQVRYRLLPDADDGESGSTRVYAYFGLGAGVVRRDYESLTGRVGLDANGLAGASVRGLAGLNYQLNRRASFYGEYSLDYVDDSLRTSNVSPHLPSTVGRVIFGLRYRFR